MLILLPFVKFFRNTAINIKNLQLPLYYTMKKLLTSIALVCYLAVSCGIVINYHYCMHRLASARLFATEKKICGKCGMHTKKSNGCCHDEVKVVKLVQDQNTLSGFHFNLPSIDAVASTPSEYIAASFYNINEQRHYLNHSPPLLSEQDTYLQINVFRI